MQNLTDFTNAIADSEVATTLFAGGIASLVGISGLSLLTYIVPSLIGSVGKLATGIAGLGKAIGGKVLYGLESLIYDLVMIGAGEGLGVAAAASLGTVTAGATALVAGMLGISAALNEVLNPVEIANREFDKANKVLEETGRRMAEDKQAMEDTSSAMDYYIDNWDTLTQKERDYYTEVLSPQYAKQQLQYQKDIRDESEASAKVQAESLDLVRAKLGDYGDTISEYDAGLGTWVDTSRTLLEVSQAQYDALDGSAEAYAKFASQYGQYADELSKARDNGLELTAVEKALITEVDYARERYGVLTGQIDENNEATQELIDYQQRVAEAFNTTDEIAQQAGEGLAKYQQALSSMTDYAAPLQGMQETFKSVKEQFEAGTLDYFEMKAAVDLFLPPEALESFGYDVQTAFAAVMDSTASQILTASDPLSAFNNLLLETANAGNMAGFSIREMDGQLVSDITNWEQAAETLNMPVGLLKAIASYAQSTSDELVIMTADLVDLAGQLETTNFASMQDALIGIGTALGESDISVVQEYVEALQEAGMIEIPDVEMDVDYTAVEEALQDVESQEPEVATTFTSDTTAPDADITRLQGTSISIPVTFTSSGMPEFAEGTDNAPAGPSLVNEEGPEIIQSGSKAYIAGGGMPTIANLRQGDKVFDADETKDILNNGGAVYNKLVSGAIGSYKNGTTDGGASYMNRTSGLITSGKSSGGGGYSGGGSSGGGSSSASAPKSKEEFDKWLKAKKHALAMDEITEREYYDELERMNEEYFANSEENQDEYWKHQEAIYKYRKDAYTDEFEDWLDEQDHLLAMDLITEQEYYDKLDEMYKQYFDGKEQYQDEYWKYEEKVYKYRQKQEEEEQKALEKELELQKDIEEALNNVAKAKSKVKYVFSGGQFGYAQDIDEVAKAQQALRDVRGYASGTISANGGLALVGENGPELRVLGNGDGIIPSEITRNLMRMGAMGTSGSAGNTFINNIQMVKLEKVNDVDELFGGLRNYAIQSAGSRA